MRKYFFTIAAIFLSVSLYAQTVEVVLLELKSNPDLDMKRSSEYVMSGALDELFTNGFVCTNSSPTSGTKKDFLSFKCTEGMKEARIDYVIVVLAEYSETAVIPNCSFRLLRVNDGKELSSGKVPLIKAKSDLQTDIDLACFAVGQSAVAACKKYVSWKFTTQALAKN